MNQDTWHRLTRHISRINNIRQELLKLEGVPTPSVARERVEEQLIELEQQLNQDITYITVQRLQHDLVMKGMGV